MAFSPWFNANTGTVTNQNTGSGTVSNGAQKVTDALMGQSSPAAPATTPATGSTPQLNSMQRSLQPLFDNLGMQMPQSWGTSPQGRDPWGQYPGQSYYGSNPGYWNFQGGGHSMGGGGSSAGSGGSM